MKLRTKPLTGPLKTACLAMERRAEAGLPAAGARGAETLPGCLRVVGLLADGCWKHALQLNLLMSAAAGASEVVDHFGNRCRPRKT